MKQQIVSALKYSIFLLIGFALLWYVFSRQDVIAMMNEIRGANYNWVLVTLFCGLLSHISRAMRWNLLINTLGYRPHLTFTFAAVMLGYLTNLFIPRGGEIVRCGTLKRYEKISFNALLGTVIIERGLDVFFLFLITFFTILFQFRFFGEFLAEHINNFIVTYTSSPIYSLFIVVGLLLVTVAFLLFRWFLPHLKKNQGFFRIKRFWVNFIAGLRSIGRIEKPLLFWMHTVFIWLMYFAMTYFVFFSLDETAHLNAGAGATILVTGGLAITLPIPGGIGSFHFMVKTALVELYGIAAEPATAYATISHAAQMLLIILLGTLSLILLPLFTKKTKRKLS